MPKGFKPAYTINQMCEIKKLCTCDKVQENQDYWKLEYHSHSWPSWGQAVDTRPEHQEQANKLAKAGAGIMGPIPMPQFSELHKGIADKSQMLKAIKAEEDWLNEENQFDFDYTPHKGDRLSFFIGGEQISFSYMDAYYDKDKIEWIDMPPKWVHKPWQAYSVDHRSYIDADLEDKEARERAAQYLEINPEY